MMAVLPGFLRSTRTAYRKSCQNPLMFASLSKSHLSTILTPEDSRRIDLRRVVERRIGSICHQPSVAQLNGAASVLTPEDSRRIDLRRVVERRIGSICHQPSVA